MPPELFDTHCHLDDEQFDGIRGEVVTRATEAGVTNFVVVGTTSDTSQKCLEIANEFDGAHAAVGIQPNYCAKATDEDWESIVELSSKPNVVAIGETGLDRYWDYTPFDIQQDFFRRHVELSNETGLPFIIHMRECGDEIVELLKPLSNQFSLNGVMHSFTGDWDLTKRCLDLGLYISFAGMLTFKKSNDLREVAAKVPEDRLLIETDAPYLSPHPKRGQRPNEPALVSLTAECLAETRGVSIEEIADTTTRNAKAFFKM